MTINSISITHALPHAFNAAAPAQSQVWCSDLTLHRGTHYLIESASGGGKSSLCSFIYGLRRDFAGTITFNSTDINTLDIDTWCEIRRFHLSLMPQEMRLFPTLTAWENVIIKNDLTHALSTKEIRQMFDHMGIEEKCNSPVRLLSIGQQQRVAIIRALCQPFDFIFLDEPVSHLDAINNRLAAELISRRALSMGASIVSTSVGNPLLLPTEVISLQL